MVFFIIFLMQPQQKNIIIFRNVTQSTLQNENACSYFAIIRCCDKNYIVLCWTKCPLCFIFKDRLDNKYKTSIGANLQCSCSSNRNDHCIHTIYVLLKIFKMSPQNPLIWQAAYVDSQLNDLLSGKHTVVESRRIVRPVFQIPQDDSDLPSKYLFQKISFQPQIKAQKMKIQQDSVCPICQQSMTQDMCLSYCKVKCGNNFHLQCLKIWAEHKSVTQAKITCPMCRTGMGNNILQQLIQQEKQFNKKEVRKALYKCSGCGVNPIPKNPHKCILCTSFQLCQCCYQAKKHIKHPFIKKNQNDKWQGTPQRRQNEIKMKQYIDNRRKQSVNDQLLKKLRKVEQDPSKLLDFVASSYPYVSKYISQNIQPNKKLGFSAQDMCCMKCGSKKMIFLRRLNCGHFIDHQCLKQYIRLGKFYCEKDGTKFAKGYEDLEKKQLSNNSIVIGEIKQEFNPMKMERNNNNQYNFVEEQAPTLVDILSGYRQSARNNNQQMRNRITSNLIQQQQIQSIPSSRKQKKQSRITDNNNNQIRIRQVSHSTKKRQNSQQPRIKPNNNNKNRRQDMQRMLENLIGKKLF